MDLEVERRFKKHLNKVCQDNQLKQYISDFFYDLAKHFEGNPFTPDNFETLPINGVETQQDVVKSVFKNKQSATAEEVFVYLFENNIQKAFFEKTLPDNVEGIYSSVERSIRILNKDPMEFYVEPQKSVIGEKPLDIDAKQWEKQKKELQKKYNDEYKQATALAWQKAVDKTNENIKHVIYHELCHLFETKTFENRNYIKVGLTTSINVKISNKEYSLYKGDINKQTTKLAKLNNKLFMSGKLKNLYNNVFDEFVDYGLKLISESMNEYFTTKIDNSLKIDNSYTPKYLPYIRKSEMEGNCTYNAQYDITLLIFNSIKDVNEKDLRMNVRKVLDQMNNLNVSELTLLETKNNFMSLIAYNSEFFLNLQEANATETLYAIMGISRNASQLTQNNKIQTKTLQEELKSLMQDLLLESYKNNIIEQINNPEIVKDENFFQNLNNQFESIDQIISYPNSYTKCATWYRDQPYVLDEREYKDIDLLSVNNFSKKDRYNIRLKAFNDVIECVKNEMYKQNIDKTKMTFFEKQKELDQKFEKVKARHQQAKQDYEEFKNKNINHDLNLEGNI